MSDWKSDARKALNYYYQSYEGSQWHELSFKSEKNLILAKICFAMFGEPKQDRLEDGDDDLSNVYSADQKQSAKKILDHIHGKVWPDIPTSTFRMMVIFVACKPEDKDLYLQPVFSIHADGDPSNPRCSRRFVDLYCRTYKDWDDFLENNRFPAVEYAYPRYGFFSCSNSREYEFDEKKEPNIAFGESPQNTVGSKVLQAADVATGVVSLASGAVCVASMFTPLGPLVAAAAIAGGGSALWGGARSVNRLVDKGKHDEDMADLESITLYLSLAATPLSFTSSILNARLVQGAIVEGRVFSSSMRTIATLVNFTTLGVSGTLVGLGFANLIEKYKADQLTALDVAQFSLSVFFFANTAIRPQVASKIIAKAQEQHFQQYSASLKDESAKQTLSKLLNDNNVDGSIQDRSIIVRTLNRIDNPESVFKNLAGAEKIEIGGRKGRTLIVTDKTQHTNRINPNRVLLGDVPPPVHVDYTGKGYENVRRALSDRDPEAVEVNGKRIFAEENLNDIQKARVKSVLGSKNAQDVKVALEFAETMSLDNVHDVLEVVEIVAADIAKMKKGSSRPVAINNIRSNMSQYVADIHKDMQKASEIAAKTNLGYKTDLSAVHHYRKHQAEFQSRIPAEPIEVYLEHAPAKLVTDANLVQIDNYQNGNVRKTYITQNNKFAVVIDGPDARTLTTMFENRNSWSKYEASLAASKVNATPFPAANIVDSITQLPRHIGILTGVQGAHFCVVLQNGQRVKLDENGYPILP